MRPQYSVVIPTYNRLDTLPEVLQALEDQAEAPTFEVIVVDDGSTDGTPSWLSGYRPDRLELRCFHQPNSGPALARNHGVAEARGARVAFLGDDTVPSTGWLAAHQAARERVVGGSRELVAVIGYTAWHPRVRLTPFLRYINEYGAQFGFSLIDDPDNVPFNFFYTSNLSVDSSALRSESFHSGFPYAAWEDIELSYRLRKRRGLRLLFEPSARVEHDHPTDLARFCGRQRKAGFAAVVFFREHPELGSFLGIGPEGPPGMPSRRRQRALESLAYGLQKLPVRLPLPWDTVLRYYYVEGMREGWGAALQSK